MDMRGVIVPVVALLLLQPSPATAQDVDAGDSKGAAIYAAACAACHGPDGRGMAQELVGFDTPLPDFTDCSFASPETTADWTTIVHDGGPARAFNRRMPAFGEALSSEEIDLVVAHVRTLCASRAWPRGELNLPRPLVTEKAFPENEIVVDLSTSSGDTRSISQRFVYEHRIGARTQYEIAVPLEMQSMADSGGAITTGLLRATQFVKDNRLLPRGFDKASASPEIAPHGTARDDEDFAGGGDRVRYVIPAGNASGPYDVTVELWYQPIGFRWARNLATYDAPEPRRFVKYYDSMATGSAVIVAKTTARVNER
jgi:mono/diheme cytochrome c family protein